MPTLSFVETHRYAYPVTTAGSGTALTVCRKSGDPYLAFVTQTGQDDEVVYLSLGFDFEYSRHVTPPGREVITGMGFNPFTGMIWCGNTTSDRDEVFAFDPVTGLEVSMRDLSADTTIGGPHGFATNGLFFTRAGGQTMELRLMNGTKIGEKNFTGRTINGITASPLSWTFIDTAAHEVVVIGPFGNELATAPLPGAAGGLAAIAYDTISDLDSHPQVWLEPGVIGAPGTIHHPDTPWTPTPWMGRHRLYIANEDDQTIYAGFLTA